MRAIISGLTEEEKKQIQLEVLEFFSKESIGATTAKLGREPAMIDRKENGQWDDVKTTIYSLRNLGILSDENSFSETLGKVYELSSIGREYYESLKDELAV